MLASGESPSAGENRRVGSSSGDGLSRQQILQQAVDRRQQQLHDRPADYVLANLINT